MSTLVKLPDDDGLRKAEIQEKQKLQQRLDELDKVQARLQERKWLEILRRQVSEREEYIQKIQNSFNSTGASDAISAKLSTTASDGVKKNSKLAPNFNLHNTAEEHATKGGTKDKTGVDILDINSLRRKLHRGGRLKKNVRS